MGREVSEAVSVRVEVGQVDQVADGLWQLADVVLRQDQLLQRRTSKRKRGYKFRIDDNAFLRTVYYEQ